MAWAATGLSLCIVFSVADQWASGCVCVSVLAYLGIFFQSSERNILKCVTPVALFLHFIFWWMRTALRDNEPQSTTWPLPCEGSHYTDIVPQPPFREAMEAPCVCLADILMMHTYSCYCHPHLQPPPRFVLWPLGGFSDPFYLMSTPWEKFFALLNRQSWRRLRGPSGMSWTTPGACSVCLSSGKNWRTGWINEHCFNAG